MPFVKKALDNKQIVLTFSFLVVVFGVIALFTMPRREDPKFNVRQGLVVAAFPGATSTQIEKEVTTKIEELLFSYKEVNKEKTYSDSRQGVLYIVVELQSFVTDADLFWSQLQHKLNVIKLTHLPSGVLGPLVESDFGDTIALLVSFKSKSRDAREVETYIDGLENELREIESLSKIKKIGTTEECFYINLDNQKLSQYKVYIPQLLLALHGENSVSVNGQLDIDGQNVAILNNNKLKSKADIENQIITSLPGIGVVRIRDIASVERSVKDQTSKTKVNGQEALLLSLEMQNGYNIVDFGQKVNNAIAQYRRIIPKDIEIEMVVNQPENVATSVNDFIREFFIAISSVIVVILLLLPFRVALIATAAIPITVAFTFTILNGVGIQLQQVSLAALIVVLGMLVDDAIVIADNYVEKIDEGMDRYEAAWKSANELKIPMLIAGLTIAGAFAPLLLLSGYVGEFIQSLPLTVAIAINASFIIAMVLTPFLCYTFIKKGIKSTEDKGGNSILDTLQKWFDQALNFAFKKPTLILSISTVSVLIGVGIYPLLDQKLFPAAERSQFVIELRAQEGTNLNTSDSLVSVLEKQIQDDKRLVNYASFIGTSVPRFYYNFSPKFPQENFSQLLINTTSNEDTDEWVDELQAQLPALFKEQSITVKKMQQGPTIEAPIEIRIKGPEKNTLQFYADSIKRMIQREQLALNVTTDTYEAQLSLSIDTKKNIANRLGLSSNTIAQEVAVAYAGIPINTVWEGKNALPVILRDRKIHEGSIDDLRSFYVSSTITGQSYPLDEVAEINTAWHPSNIRHRNGTPTITVLCYIKESELPSRVLINIQDLLNEIKLPTGYKMEFGGEDENQIETFTEMNRVMVISLFIIFAIILLQFKNLRDTFIVLSAIPLSIFGATFGLYILNYPFGFTAFVGLASLVGVSVRNSIILVDYANELRETQNMTKSEAALSAGKRRIRPIFLTTMAAAVGVTPMIISGSPMWAPLATVLAIGLVFSMFMTLLTIPVLYSKFATPKAIVKILALPLLFFFSYPSDSQAQDTVSLSLNTCMLQAKENNAQLELLGLEVERKELEVKQIKANRLPKVVLDGGYFWYYNSERTTDTEISVNNLPLLGAVPNIPFGAELTIPENNRFIGVANLGVYQPLTPLFSINAGASVKETELSLIKSQFQKAQNDVSQAVVQLYVGMIISQTKVAMYDEQFVLIKEQIRQAESASKEGEILNVYSYGLKADLLDHQTKQSQAKTELLNYRYKMNQILGFNQDSIWQVNDFKVDSNEVNNVLLASTADSVYLNNPEVITSSLNVQKANYGVQFYKNRIIPDVVLTAQAFYFGNIPVVPEENVFVGATLTWPILQWGKKNMDVKMAQIQLRQAQIQEKDTRQAIDSKVLTKAEELKNAQEVVKTAELALKFRTEEFRIQQDAFNNGLISFNDFSETQKKYLETKILVIKANANLAIKQMELMHLMSMN